VRKLVQKRTYEVALSKAGLGPVAGVDEAGRGACAGPITIAACILPEKIIPSLATLTDSKKLSAKQREELFPAIQRNALAYSIVHIDPEDIDKHGIQHANVSGMRRAVARLELRPRYILTDALKVSGFTAPYLPVVGGDFAIRCIAAASVLAKVSRDHIMEELEEKYPGYGLGKHKGYGTAVHTEAIKTLGATAIHRMSYSNVANAQLEFEMTKVNPSIVEGEK
jgi:ribonuclease HII